MTCANILRGVSSEPDGALEDPNNPGVFTYPDGANRLYIVDPASWQGEPLPERQWVLDQWLPTRRAAYLTGAGGAGKSLLAQILATCVAVGMPFMGIACEQKPSLYVTCEDDEDELHRRQAAICNGLGIHMRDLRGKLHLLSLMGQIENELVHFEHDGPMEKTRMWNDIHIACTEHLKAGFVVLDNVAHLYGGNENDRPKVTAFANLLNGLAKDIDGAVLLIGHPNKSGDAYSGSTAWENAFRARLYLDAPKPGDEAEGDPNVRMLSRPKANYAEPGAPIKIRWHQGTFLLDQDIPPSLSEEIRKVSAHTAANDAFLRCLAAATKQRRAVSHNPGVNYAPKQFTMMTEGKGYTVQAFRGAMERLAHLGVIAFDRKLWQGENYHWKRGIVLAESDPLTPANPHAETAENRPLTPSANPPLTPAANPQKTVRQPPPADPLYTTYISGGASEAPPPDYNQDDVPLDWETE